MKFQINSGFTLIEFLLVVALVTTLSLLSVGFYSRFLTQDAVANTVDQLTGDFRKAQIYAMMGRGDGNWGVNFATNTLTLYRGASFATRTTADKAFDETFSINQNISISGFSDLNFTKRTGLPGATPTITISGNNTTKTVTINAQGIASR